MTGETSYAIWETDFGHHVIPAELYKSAKFCRDGSLDKRYRSRNKAMAAWVNGLGAADSRYTITAKGRELLEGK